MAIRARLELEAAIGLEFGIEGFGVIRFCFIEKCEPGVQDEFNLFWIRGTGGVLSVDEYLNACVDLYFDRRGANEDVSGLQRRGGGNVCCEL